MWLSSSFSVSSQFQDTIADQEETFNEHGLLVFTQPSGILECGHKCKQTQLCKVTTRVYAISLVLHVIACQQGVIRVEPGGWEQVKQVSATYHFQWRQAWPFGAAATLANWLGAWNKLDLALAVCIYSSTHTCPHTLLPLLHAAACSGTKWCLMASATRWRCSRCLR